MEFNVTNPKTTEELLKVIGENQSNEFKFGAGYTDLILDLRKRSENNLIVINLARLKDRQFTSIEKTNEGIWIGALVTINEIISDSILSKGNQFQVLIKAAKEFASRQIRQVATVGGNLCTASPAGDVACALTALKAQCEILSTNGKLRVIPINDFFIDVKKTCLKKNEILRSVFITLNGNDKKTYSDYIKIGTRQSMEIAIVSLAYHIQTDRDDYITHAGIAIGSVAPTIKFAESACEYLVCKKFSSISKSESEEFAAKVLVYATPISDIRASAWYRKEVLYNISKGIF
jgi:CO/xanthine dehydrogenase FAD-binding subunit